MSRLPQTPKDVLAVIHKAESSRKFVWTAGRVLIEGGFEQLWDNADAKNKKKMLKSITKLLKSLASEGILEPRSELQSIGYGSEEGFNFLTPARIPNRRTTESTI